MPATARISEFFSKSPKRLPAVRQIFVYITLVFLLPHLLFPNAHPVYFISFCSSTHIVAKTRISECQRVLSQGEAEHTHIHINVSPVFGYTFHHTSFQDTTFVWRSPHKFVRLPCSYGTDCRKLKIWIWCVSSVTIFFTDIVKMVSLFES
jgi:hypothetical protein